MNDIYEIEKKYLIRFPSDCFLEKCHVSYDIEQVYLHKDELGFSSRIRKRTSGDNVEFFHTRKKRISDMRRIELETMISEDEYTQLLTKKDPDKTILFKRRFCYEYKGKVFEIDIFPFWDDRAFLEIELSDESESFVIPEDLEVIKEVTDDSRYTNSSLAAEIPYELI